MPINAHPDFLAAEKEYLLAVDPEEKIEQLKKMISLCPSHKGAENLRAQLRARLKRLQEQLIRFKKTKNNWDYIKNLGKEFEAEYSDRIKSITSIIQKIVGRKWEDEIIN